MRIKWVVWACFLVVGIAASIVPSVSAQDTSTPEEQAQWVTITHKLENNPLDDSMDALGHAVVVQGTRVQLTEQNFRLLNCLYECKDGVCRAEVLVRYGLEESYFDEKDEHQKGRLTMAIHRLREKIEHNPERPRFVRKEAGGYRLYRDPDK